jgi:hypothetical protein
MVTEVHKEQKAHKDSREQEEIGVLMEIEEPKVLVDRKVGWEPQVPHEVHTEQEDHKVSKVRKVQIEVHTVKEVHKVQRVHKDGTVQQVL